MAEPEEEGPASDGEFGLMDDGPKESELLLLGEKG